MSRRRRSILFMVAALAAAAAAAAMAQRYGASVTRGYGPLRTVVVTGGDLPAARIGPDEISDLVVRRVPQRFVPPDTLSSPAEALGLVAAAPLPAGAYLLASQLRPPRERNRRGGRLSSGRSPLEITVVGAGALLEAEAAGRSRVDIVLSGGAAQASGRVGVAAAAVPLLALRAGSEGVGPTATAAATVGVTRRQALRLIGAESEGSRITLLPAR